MQWLNYHHLLYFWVTAREGSLTRAARTLRLAPSTVSTQIRALEESLGTPLFRREGRGLALTEQGRLARAYADEIFGLGQELLGALQDPGGGAVVHTLRVGIADIVHKWLAHRILAPTLGSGAQRVHLVCRCEPAERLVADLALHALDVLFSDAPVGVAQDVRAHSRLVGSVPVDLVGSPELVAAHRTGFPGSLDGAPLLMPEAGTALRRQLDDWFLSRSLRPQVVAEFGDSGLMKAFGRDGAGLLPVPRLVSAEVCEVYGLDVLGPLDGVEERLYAVTADERPSPLAARLIAHAAQALGDPAGGAEPLG